MEYQVIGNVCSCKVLNFISNNREVISEIDGLPEDSGNNNNVELLLIDEQKMKLLPHDLNLYFPNLKGLIIDSSELNSITRGDIQQFPSLRFLMIGNNNIESLGDDLFENNTSIEWLSLINNFIKRIGSETLTPLRNLKFANFQRNSCINFKATDDSSIEKLKSLINKDCNV